MPRAVSGTKTGTLTLGLAIEFAPFRPPLDLLFDPEGVPFWAPGIGFGVARWVLHPRPSLEGFIPEGVNLEGVVHEAIGALMRGPVPVDANTLNTAPLPSGGGITAGGGLEAHSPIPSPLYTEVFRLARVARATPPDDPRFAHAALETASRIGMLNPRWADPVAAWHDFAQEGVFYLDLLRASQEGGGVEVALQTLDSPEEPWMATYRELLEAWRGVEGVSAEAVARHLSTAALGEILSHLTLTPDGRVKASVGARAWVRHELAQAFTERRVRFCPVCGAPFLGRADRETCRSDRCRKAWYRMKMRPK